jgi:hypothetical protein
VNVRHLRVESLKGLRWRGYVRESTAAPAVSNALRGLHVFRNVNPEAKCPFCGFPAWSHDPAMAFLMNAPIVAP